LLRCPVDFAQTVDNWVLAQRVMDLPIVSGDSQLLKILTAHADAICLPRGTRSPGYRASWQTSSPAFSLAASRGPQWWRGSSA
jgi:hypothetical protein